MTYLYIYVRINIPFYFLESLPYWSRKKWRKTMQKSWKFEGVISILIFSLWVPFVLIGTGPMASIYDAIGINQTIMLGFTSIICLIYILIQIMWAVSPLAEEKTFDTLLSLLPMGVMLGVTILVMVTPIEMSPEPTFWLTNWIVLSITLIIDLWVGNATANMVLTLKDVETRTEK